MYRTHTCGELRKEQVGQKVQLAGWVYRKRDHGNLLFVDLRDHEGVTQCVSEQGSPAFVALDSMRLESVVTVTGTVVQRALEVVNDKLPTGAIELVLEDVALLSAAEPLPFPVTAEGATYPEDLRLRYRFLDLRREELHQNLVLRSQIIRFLREEMQQAGFLEIQTPILTASSPEGARDFLVPSRLHPGRFYALPQAPQQFKQLLMVSGFDRYFQIAPCFRDEDSRADRSPGEFYQLDMEMAFVTQEEVFSVIEPLLQHTFVRFGKGACISDLPFPRIPYEEAMRVYGSDKPDLRNPLRITEVTEVFAASSFALFSQAVAQGSRVQAIGVPVDPRPYGRRFFDELNEWARSEEMGGLAYVLFSDSESKGPIAKFLSPAQQAELKSQTGIAQDGVVFFVCASPGKSLKDAGLVRKKLGEAFDLVEKDAFRFCWITDFPMYERDEGTGVLSFSHNPFSMPQGGLAALETQDPLTIKAYQYDIVCNGVELSSGALRNHLPEVMFKAFSIAGYSKEEVEARFGGLLHAFQYGAPPHGGCAPGIDRMVMLLCGASNLREVTAFPLNQKAEDLMMGAPAEVQEAQLKELCMSIRKPTAHPSGGTSL
ncbi:MAG: aspartate--tRNA ligase [Holosporales bacterium]|jgi:aspartyl-tRNA synthetase|nr:aspartate--tRNA ligase [Holosporales bacterium]